MWLPYDTSGSLKAETDAETIRLSRLDSTQRNFLVGFFFRNPVTQAWEADLRAGAAGTTFACKLGGASAEIGFYGNDAGKLSEVLFRLTARNAQDALRLAHEDLEGRIERLVAETGRGVDVVGWRVADMSHGARWRCTPFRPSALSVSYEAADPVPTDLRPLASLYKRARNAPDSNYRLLCAFAVLVGAAEPGGPLAAGTRDSFTVTQEMLIHAGALEFASDLARKSLLELISFLRPRHDSLFAGPNLLAALATDQEATQPMGALANLADLAAHRLLLGELRHRTAALVEQPLQPVD